LGAAVSETIQGAAGSDARVTRTVVDAVASERAASLIVTVNVAVVLACTSAGASSAMISGAVGVVRLTLSPNPRG
jgi:hypothetical protein